jgi:hypothetical protein
MLLVGTSLSADDKKTDDKKPDNPKEPAAKGTLPANWKKLGLTDDQVKKVYRIQTDYRGKIDELQEKINALKKQERTDMEKVLTDAQKARLKELRDSAAGGATKPPASE